MEKVQNFWNERYENKDTPWDLNNYAPPFKTFLDTHHLNLGHAAIIGCGSGHECELFARYNFTVTGIDFADGAIAQTKQKLENIGIYGKSGFVLNQDFFEIKDTNCFDIVVEHTFFCAINPKLRPQYFNVVKQILKPNGIFIGLFWLMNKTDGPPFGSTKKEVLAYFENDFEIIDSYVPDNSTKSRFNSEFMIYAKLK